jgi:hypothetical protein
MLIALLLTGCTAPTTSEDGCGTDGALASCLEPTQSEAYYIEQSSMYFDTMDYTVDLEVPPAYSELVARWEWPPWLKLTAFGLENITATDTLLQLYPSVVPERECLAFDEQPFGRCYVVFYYDDHDGKSCPIYEEFTFNDDGEITFIEAWSDQPGMLPMADESDRWGEARTDRLSERVPGLGRPDGLIDLDGEAMLAAAETDEVLADFLYRANDWQETWLEEYAASDGEQMWITGCGWQ